jgi:pyruvate/2-oxoglutarate dehydrogenase complex dihydrolipoamide acyltransferase (E2) component
MGTRATGNARVDAGLIEEDFEQQPSDETTAAGEAIDFDAIDEQTRAQAAAGVQNPYASPEEQGMELTAKTVGPPQYGSPDPTTAASRLATLEDGHPLDPGLLPEGHPAAISDDYGIQTVDVDDPTAGTEEQTTGDQTNEIDATDSAIELAREENVDLSEVKGTGVEGRIIKGDVEDFITERDKS